MKVVLIGFMGSGKSKVGRLLAQRLGLHHFDTDEMISKDVGAPVAEIIAKQGEAAFREIEKKAIALVGSFDNCVISTGGGVPLDPTNMKNLSLGAELVWLQVSPEMVLKRAGNLKSRPLIDPQDPLNSIRKKLEERQPFYAVAPHRVDTDSMEPAQIVEKILAMIPSVAQ
jgi:shikimate kinase